MGLVAGAILGLPVAIISATISQVPTSAFLVFFWVLALFCVWGLIAVATARRLLPQFSLAIDGSAAQAETRSAKVVGRRQFLIQIGAATATVTVVGAGLGRFLELDERNRLEAELEAMKESLPQAPVVVELPNEDDPVKPALGTRPEYTAVRDHYKIFIRSEPTVIDGETWTLPITGLVDNPMDLTLNDIMTRYEPHSEFVTLSCISNRVGGPLIGTTYWTGASLQEILADAGLQADRAIPADYQRRRLLRDRRSGPD